MKMKKETKSKPALRLFRCIPKDKCATCTDILQGIIYPSGICRVGVDVWRDLDKCDCSSHETITYSNIDDVREKYNIVSTKKNEIIG